MKFNRLMFALLIFLCAFTACSTATTNEATQSQAEIGDLPDETAIENNDIPTGPDMPPLPTFDRSPISAIRGQFFNTSGNCAACHESFTDSNGEEIFMAALWRPSMMSNAAIDPYWQATVRAETLENPALAEIIEDKCATCHMPMARTTSALLEQSTRLLDEGYLSADHELNPMAMEGVSCTLCHQIQPDNFGTEDGASGHYLIDAETEQGTRITYGPFPIDEALAQMMLNSSGFLHTQSEHIRQAELCATCHTLFTPYVDASGEVLGEFPEQTPYAEWLNSDYIDQASCQECHMPVVEEAVPVSVIGEPLHEGVRKHTFMGGNNYVLNILRYAGGDLGTSASSADFDAAIARMEKQMQTEAATIEIANPQIVEDVLNFDVTISSLTGHKLPTGFPSRRVWLHVTVTDSANNVIFESGAYTHAGTIIGNANDEDAALYEPHYTTIAAPDQVQIYETILLNSDGQVTMTLLRAAQYAKDNRLLPLGFDLDGATDPIAVYGEAAADPDFIGGFDTIAYAVNLGDVSGAYTISAELLYQSIGYRWGEKLREYDSAETNLFASYLDTMPNLPTLIAEFTLSVAK